MESGRDVAGVGVEPSVQALKNALRAHDEFCRQRGHLDNVFAQALGYIEKLESLKVTFDPPPR
jgi:hypothetical protein